MISKAEVRPGNGWRYLFRGVMVGDGHRAAGTPLHAAQDEAGVPPGVWRGRGLAAVGLKAGDVVTERQAELLLGEGRHPDADRIERERLEAGDDPATARRATVLGRPIEHNRSPKTEKAKERTPWLAMDLVFRAPSTAHIAWALGDDETRVVLQLCQDIARDKALAWLEDEVAEIRWGSGGKHRKPIRDGLIVAVFRHYESRAAESKPLLHDHAVVSIRARRPDDKGTWGNLSADSLMTHIVAADTLYLLYFMEEVSARLGWAWEPREVTPGRRPVMEIAGVDQELIDWSSTRRQRIEDALEGLTDEYVAKHGRLPGERARHGLGWWAAQDTRPEKKTPKPLEQLRAWWRASAILNFGQRMVDGLLQRCRAAGKAIRARVGPRVDTALAAIDVAAIVYIVRNTFARRHVLAEARRHLLETLRGRAFPPGLDDYIAEAALARYSRQLTVPQKGRRTPAPDQLTYTADFAWPARWWVVGTDGKPPRAATRYERARVASLALQNAIRAARTTPAARDEAPDVTVSATARAVDHHHDQAATAPHVVGHPGRDAALTPVQRAAAVHAHQQAAMPQEYLEGRTTDPATWMRTPANLERLAAITRAADARRRAIEDRELPAPAADLVDPRRQEHEQQHPQPGPSQGIQP